MYNRTLRIGLFGMDDEIVDALRELPAPDRFTFEFFSADAVDYAAAFRCEIMIAAMGSWGSSPLLDISAALHSDETGFHALALVAAPEDIADWGAKEYNMVDAIWPAPLSVNRAIFEFEKLAAAAKAQAEEYITGTYLDTIINSMPEMVWFKALDGEHVKVNDYFCDIVDKVRWDVEGQFHNYIWNVPPEDWEKAELTCKESDGAAIEAGDTIQCEELVSTHGEIRTFDTYKTPIYDEDGSVLGTSGFAHDITLERQLQELAWRNARTDYLTGLYNRRYFYEYLEEHAGEGPMTFALVDLDNFKGINDGSGHSEGDNALLVTAAALKKSFPECAIVRWGGDEFVVVIPQAQAALAEDANLAEFQRTIYTWTDEKCPTALTCSIGVAQAEDNQAVDDAIKDADDALYQAKQAGKNRFIRFSA